MHARICIFALLSIVLQAVYGEVVSGAACCGVATNPNVVSYSMVVNFLPERGYYLSYTLSVPVIDDDPQNGKLYASVGTSAPVFVCDGCTSATFTTPFEPVTMLLGLATPPVNFLLVRDDGTQVNLNFTCDAGDNQAGPQYCFNAVQPTTVVSTTATTYSVIAQSVCSCGAIVSNVPPSPTNELIPDGILASSGEYFEVLQLQAQPLPGFQVATVILEVDDQVPIQAFAGQASSFLGTFYAPFTPIPGDGPDSYGTDYVSANVSFTDSAGLEYTELYHLQSCRRPDPPTSPGYPALCFASTSISSSTSTSSSSSSSTSTGSTSTSSTSTGSTSTSSTSTSSNSTITIQTTASATSTSESSISSIASNTSLVSSRQVTNQTSTALNTTHSVTEMSTVTISASHGTEPILSTTIAEPSQQSQESVTVPVSTGVTNSHVQSLTNIQPQLPQSAPRVGMGLRNQLSAFSLAGLYALALHLV